MYKHMIEMWWSTSKHGGLNMESIGINGKISDASVDIYLMLINTYKLTTGSHK